MRRGWDESNTAEVGGSVPDIMGGARGTGFEFKFVMVVDVSLI